MRRIQLLLIALLSRPVLADEPACSPQTPVAASCLLALDALHPTQPAVGELQVAEEVKTLRLRPDLASWQKKRPLPVVLGPAGEFYLTDGHHAARGLWEVGQKSLLVTLAGKLDDPADFWSQMQARHWVYLFDEHGQPISPAQLPQRIADLRDDPYRALAGFARRQGYFRKSDAWFVEFEWARYFGQALNWQPIDAEHLPWAMNAARQLACAPAARNLPGYSAEACNSAVKPAQ